MVGFFWGLGIDIFGFVAFMLDWTASDSVCLILFIFHGDDGQALDHLHERRTLPWSPASENGRDVCLDCLDNFLENIYSCS